MQAAWLLITMLDCFLWGYTDTKSFSIMGYTDTNIQCNGYTDIQYHVAGVIVELCVRHPRCPEEEHVAQPQGSLPGTPDA